MPTLIAIANDWEGDREDALRRLLLLVRETAWWLVDIIAGITSPWQAT